MEQRVDEKTQPNVHACMYMTQRSHAPRVKCRVSDRTLDEVGVFATFTSWDDGAREHTDCLSYDAERLTTSGKSALIYICN